jgi:hypothetical protein
MNTSEISPFIQTPLMMAIPRKDRNGINRGASRSLRLLLQTELEANISGSQDYDWTIRAHRVGISPFLLPEVRVIHDASDRKSFKAVWTRWARNAFYNWRIRIRYQDFLRTPAILRFPLLILICSPILAIWPTLRIMRTSPRSFFKYIYLIPAVYLTKIAWCWGVFHAATETKNLGS